MRRNGLPPGAYNLPPGVRLDEIPGNGPADEEPPEGRSTFCMIAGLHASKDLEQDAGPCQCSHCERMCDCPE